MASREALLTRLQEIAESIAQSGHGLAVLGLGSCGLETQRLDDSSDLDFFVIVEAGHKARYIDNLDWLSSITPLAYQFRNTVDGYKALFEDGIFCEFAVFEPQEMRGIPFAPGRIIWKRADVDESISIPAKNPHPVGSHSPEWLLGEALTNLYVGMCRFRRGEKLSAQRFVQHYAVDRVVELHELGAPSSAVDADAFSVERRLEQRRPDLALHLSRFIQGYERTPESAEAILDFLRAKHDVNPGIASVIQQLCRAR